MGSSLAWFSTLSLPTWPSCIWSVNCKNLTTVSTSSWETRVQRSSEGCLMASTHMTPQMSCIHKLAWWLGLTMSPSTFDAEVGTALNHHNIKLIPLTVWQIWVSPLHGGSQNSHRIQCVRALDLIPKAWEKQTGPLLLESLCMPSVFPNTLRTSHLHLTEFLPSKESLESSAFSCVPPTKSSLDPVKSVVRESRELIIIIELQLRFWQDSKYCRQMSQ